MNVQAAQAYARTSQMTGNAREIEAQALLKAAKQLRDVQTNWTGPDAKMHKALLFNRRLWTIFMSAVESDDNPQPIEVRQNIANISVFVMHQTIDMQMATGSDKLKPLIDINCQDRGRPCRQGLKTFRELSLDLILRRHVGRKRARRRVLGKSSEWK